LSSYFDALSIDSTVAISFLIEELGSFDGKKRARKRELMMNKLTKIN
jgi:hypothetical protein